MKRLAGILCGVLSAVSYGTNPLFAVPLLRGGYGVDSMLFFRFSAAALLLAPIVAAFGEGFRTTRAEAGLLMLLGALFAFSSQALFWSFTLMPAGIASAILFLYPIFTAAIMAVLFHTLCGPDSRGGSGGVRARHGGRVLLRLFGRGFHRQDSVRNSARYNIGRSDFAARA